MTKFRAIIFDLDGLLVDSETVWHRAETAYIASLGHEYTAELRASIIGLRLDAMTKIWRDYYHLPLSVDQLAQGLTNDFLKLVPAEVKANPGAAELIAYIREQRIPTAIASSSPLSVIDAIVDSQGWGDVLEIRCTADDVAYGKPAPDVYLAAAQVLEIAPADCLALEDSPAGVTAAVAAGMTCYAVPDTSHSPREAFKDITPHVYNDLHEVLAELR
jgi:HAD superfamily hydrolase (TIGR01509 family)